MKLFDYLKDQVGYIFTNIFFMIALSVFLSEVGNEIGIVILILISWLAVMVGYLAVKYCSRKRYLMQLLNFIDQLDEKYLISEIMERPIRLDDKIYYYILKAANKSMLEQISAASRERKEYKEYIEQWIHEVKTPIAAMKLVCDNHKSDISRTLLLEIEKINHFAEQALYYARSENVEKDYLIKETALSEIVHDAITENKQLLLRNGISVHVENCYLTVYTDEKWIGFILNQLIVNAVKYKSDSPKLIFEARVVQGGIALSIFDNGIGIIESDLPRIFEKGFTGENGREEKYSTGIGLYLCKRLADKLGIEIIARSIQGEGTEITLIFPKGSFVKVQD